VLAANAKTLQDKNSQLNKCYSFFGASNPKMNKIMVLTLIGHF